MVVAGKTRQFSWFCIRLVAQVEERPNLHSMAVLKRQISYNQNTDYIEHLFICRQSKYIAFGKNNKKGTFSREGRTRSSDVMTLSCLCPTTELWGLVYTCTKILILVNIPRTSFETRYAWLKAWANNQIFSLPQLFIITINKSCHNQF